VSALFTCACRFADTRGDGGGAGEQVRTAGHGSDALDRERKRRQALPVHAARLHDESLDRRHHAQTHVPRSTFLVCNIIFICVIQYALSDCFYLTF